jgi:glutamate synthase (NADPH/NADH) large chain
LFAQVTNPPIDSIREEIVMSLRCFIGPEGNLLQTTPEQANRLSLDHPILSNQQLTDIRDMDYHGMKTKLIDSTFDSGEENGFENALDRICAEAETAIGDGFAFVIISDRLTSALRTPLNANRVDN